MMQPDLNHETNSGSWYLYRLCRLSDSYCSCPTRIFPVFAARMKRNMYSVLPLSLPVPGAVVLDRLGRPLRDLRISVTDTLQFPVVLIACRSKYSARIFPVSFLIRICFLSREITRLARLFVSMGVEKIRLTGGEPLLRRHVERLVGQLAGLKTPGGRPVDVTLTTNGSLLARKARRTLFDAGLRRVTVSLDALDDTVFMKMNDVGFRVADVTERYRARLICPPGFLGQGQHGRRKRHEQKMQVLPLARIFQEYLCYRPVHRIHGCRHDE